MPRSLTGLPVRDYEAITVSTTAVGLTRSKYDKVDPPHGAVLTVESASLRFREDGTDPTSSQGHLLNVGAVLTLDNPSRMEKFRAIRSGSTDATLRISYRG